MQREPSPSTPPPAPRGDGAVTKPEEDCGAPRAASPVETRAAAPDLELLAVRCQLGEAAAFDELVARWHEPLWRYLLAITGRSEQAEELIQEAWLRIFRGIDRLRRPERLRAWLFSIARRTAVDRLRLRYAEAATGPLDEEPAGPEPPDRLEWEDLEQLDQALQHLAPGDREVTVLFYLRELDLREVAEVLALPIGTVKSRLHRSRRLLRQLLEAKGMHR